MAGAAGATGSLGDIAVDSFWGRKFLVIITGASGGIGRAVAVGFSKHVAHGSLIVITGRRTAGLEETKRLVCDSAPGVNVVAETFDHSKATFRDNLDLIFRNSGKVQDPERVVLIHNAGTIGDNSKYTKSYNSEAEIDDYFHLNLTSMMTLTAAFLQHYDDESKLSRTIVNITSITSLRATPGLGLYCTGKAARDMYMKVVAAENPSLSVLSYAPGPVDTAMFDQLGKGVKECADTAQDARDDKRVLTPEATVARLIKILGDREFESGAHLDYYDFPTTN